LTPEQQRSLVAPELRDDAHKGVAGRLLNLSGSREMPGAAVLCARGAMRGGAGLVTAGCLDETLLRILPIAVPEVVLRDLGRLSDLPFLLETGDFHAIVVGPGLGLERGKEVLQALLRARRRLDGGRPLVLDADALNALADKPESLRDEPGTLVLTPAKRDACSAARSPMTSEDGSSSRASWPTRPARWSASRAAAPWSCTAT